MFSSFVEALCGGLCFNRLHNTAVKEAHIEPQEHITSVLLLPEDVMRRHVLSFLKFREVVRLDSALVHHTMKSYFLSALHATVVEGIVDVRHLDWCRKRKCSAKTLRITSALDNEDYLVDEMHFAELRIHATAKVSEHALHRLLVEGKDFRILSIRSFCIIRPHHFLPSDTHLPLLEIYASGNMHIKEDVLLALVVCCPYLRKIHAIGCYLCSEHLALALAEHCPQLREALLTIHISLDAPPTEDPQSTGYCELFRACRQLQIVECTGHFTIANLQTLADNCRELTSVSLRSAYTLSWWGETHTALVDSALSSLVRNNTNIHTLKLDTFRRLSDGSLLSVAQSLPDLHTFCLTNSRGTLAGLSAIRASCLKLTCFEVFPYRSQAPVDTLHCSYLQLCIINTLSINSTTLTDAQLVTTAQANPNMRALHIQPLVYAKGNILSTTALCEALSYWHSLDTFNVRKCTELQNLYPSAFHLEDSVLYALAQHCAKLGSMDITGHGTLSSMALSALSNLPLLRALAANRCVNMTDSVLTTIATQCPLLEVIELAHCPQITYVGIYALANHCRSLTSVQLQGCGDVSNSAIQHLIRRSRHLQRLDLTSNPLLSFAAVAELPKYCLCMRHLRLYSTITKPLVVEFYAAYRSNRRYFDIIFGWSEELRFPYE